MATLDKTSAPHVPPPLLYCNRRFCCRWSDRQPRKARHSSNSDYVYRAFPQDEMTPLQRTLAVALVTAEVHNRDVLEGLISKNVDDSQNFIWQAQLRYVRNCHSSDSL